MNDFKYLSIRSKVTVAALIFAALLVTCFSVSLIMKKDDRLVIGAEVSMPRHWDSDYLEETNGFLLVEEMSQIDWEHYEGVYDEIFDTVEINEAIASASFTYTIDTVPRTANKTKSDDLIIMMSENEAWDYISNGLYKSYPTGSFKDNKKTLEKLQNESTEVITVKCWYWANPEDETDMTKTTVTKKFAVNSNISSLFKHAFEDIYNHPSKPIINIGDKGMGTWVLRGKMHNENRSLSAHSLGCCIDINPSTGSFKVNGTWYGNAYGQRPMSEAIWNELPETHTKHHVLYQGSPIVEIFKSYGFVWGGDWKSGTDVMHFSFIGDGQTCRQQGQKNYIERK